MAKNFYTWDEKIAQNDEGYLIDWTLRRQQTERICKYLHQLLSNRYTTGEAIRLAVGISSNTITNIRNDRIPNQVLTDIGMRRLAFGIISLLPDLSVNEKFKKDILGQFNPHRTHAFISDKILMKQRDMFVEAFGYVGRQIVYELKDFSQVDKILSYYRKLFKNVKKENDNNRKRDHK